MYDYRIAVAYEVVGPFESLCVCARTCSRACNKQQETKKNHLSSLFFCHSVASMLARCWAREPAARPSFMDIDSAFDVVLAECAVEVKKPQPAATRHTRTARTKHTHGSEILTLLLMWR